jgi:hypothetical protein
MVWRAWTTEPAGGDVETMCPCPAVCDRTFWTATKTPRLESSATPVGVTVPTTFGSTILADGHGTVLEVSPLLPTSVTVSTWQG